MVHLPTRLLCNFWDGDGFENLTGKVYPGAGINGKRWVGYERRGQNVVEDAVDVLAKALGEHFAAFTCCCG